MNGDCRDCGVSKNLKYDECEVLSGKHDVIDVMEWSYAKHAGIKKNQESKILNLSYLSLNSKFMM